MFSKQCYGNNQTHLNNLTQTCNYTIGCLDINRAYIHTRYNGTRTELNVVGKTRLCVCCFFQIVDKRTLTRDGEDIISSTDSFLPLYLVVSNTIFGIRHTVERLSQVFTRKNISNTFQTRVSGL